MSDPDGWYTIIPSFGYGVYTSVPRPRIGLGPPLSVVPSRGIEPHLNEQQKSFVNRALSWFAVG